MFVLCVKSMSPQGRGAARDTLRIGICCSCRVPPCWNGAVVDSNLMIWDSDRISLVPLENQIFFFGADVFSVFPSPGVLIEGLGSKIPKKVAYRWEMECQIPPLLCDLSFCLRLMRRCPRRRGVDRDPSQAVGWQNKV